MSKSEWSYGKERLMTSIIKASFENRTEFEKKVTTIMLNQIDIVNDEYTRQYKNQMDSTISDSITQIAIELRILGEHVFGKDEDGHTVYVWELNEMDRDLFRRCINNLYLLPCSHETWGEDAI